MKNYFQLDKYRTNFKREILGGIITFLSTVCILAADPQVSSSVGVRGASEDMKMDQGTTFVATILAAFIDLLSMGLVAKYPIALVLGIGLNAFFASIAMLTMDTPWQVGSASASSSGIFSVILTATRLRKVIANAILYRMKVAVSVGIGLFITFVGLRSLGTIVENESTLITLGHLADPSVLLVISGIVITAILYAIKLPGSIFIGMIITAVAGMLTGSIQMPSDTVGKIPNIEPAFGAAFEAFKDSSQLLTIQSLIIILMSLFIDFFDTAGALVAVVTQAGIMEDNKSPRAGRALPSDSSATTVGSVSGTTTTTSYIESASGVAAGAGTGLVSIAAGCCSLLALFLSPLIVVVTSAVMTPALVVVGVLMAVDFAEINWKSFEVAVPVFITIIMMSLSHSIITGIVYEFILYPITMPISKKYKEIYPIMYILMVLFILYSTSVHG